MTKTIFKKIKKITSNQKYIEILFLIFVFFSSLFIRRIGLKFGFPLLTHHDEAISLDPIYKMTVNRTFNPGDFRRPDQIQYLFNFFYLNLISFIKFNKSLAQTYLENKLIFYFYARLLIAFIGSIIPLAAYKIGKQFKIDFSKPAALLFAFFPIYVSHSHFITPDIPITFFTLLVILFSIRYVKERQDKQIYIATVFSAINTAEKYPGLLSFGIVIVALIIRITADKQHWTNDNLRDFFKKALLMIGVFIFSLYIVAPNIFIEYGQVIDSIMIEARSVHLGADNLGWGGNILFYIKQFISTSNPIMIFFLFIGLFSLIKNKNIIGVLLLYGFAYCLILSRLGLHWVRWALPMYTTPLLLISAGFSYLLHISKNNRILKSIIAVIFLISIMQQSLTSLANSTRMGFTDTRAAALEYCNQNGITSKNSIYEGYTPFSSQFYKEVSSEDIKEENDSISYIILSSQMYNRYFDEPVRYKEQVSFYNEIDRNHKIIRVFSPTPEPNSLPGKMDQIAFYFSRYFKNTKNERFNGPTIKIYRIDW